MEELFDAVGDAIGRDPYRLSAGYDPARGHPVSLFVDYERYTADEENGFEVTDFAVLR